jgi:cupin 2 domain-containing protein
VIAKRSIFDGVPADLSEEHTMKLLETETLRLERIVSRGHSNPEGFWYDQDHDEWVLLLSGRAVLRFEEQPEPVHLERGDHLFIPAHCRHRVEWTDPRSDTVWLAAHLTQ